VIFFELFRPVFARNARWSIKKSVPLLGDENTPYEDVEEFYSFWRNFASWRDFSFLDEYDPETAEYREEKRWMERQNKKIKEKAKREETARINRLIEMAYKKDPRVAKALQLEKELKQKQKQAKFDAKKREIEEQERQLAEERKKKRRRSKSKRGRSS